MSSLTSVFTNIVNAQKAKKAYTVTHKTNAVVLKALRFLWSEGLLNGLLLDDSMTHVTIFLKYTQAGRPAFRGFKAFASQVPVQQQSMAKVIINSECVVVSAGDDVYLFRDLPAKVPSRPALLFAIN